MIVGDNDAKQPPYFGINLLDLKTHLNRLLIQKLQAFKPQVQLSFDAPKSVYCSPFQSIDFPMGYT